MTPIVICPHCRRRHRKDLFVANYCPRCGKRYDLADLECVQEARLAIYKPKAGARAGA